MVRGVAVDAATRVCEQDCLLIFCSPFTRSGVMPIGGRSTAVKLTNGDLWVIASTPLTKETRAKLDELGGRVAYLVGPDVEHTMFLREFELESKSDLAEG